MGCLLWFRLVKGEFLPLKMLFFMEDFELQLLLMVDHCLLVSLASFGPFP